MPKLQIHGFPNEISNKIEMPDIAELLMYPLFTRMEAENFFKYATDFQKKLFDMCPLKNNTRHVIVLSTVTILDPRKRVITYPNSHGGEWHVDGTFGSMFEQKDTLHLLLSHTTATTEFNTNAMELDLHEGMTRREFGALINSNKIEPLLVPKSIETDKICTFNSYHIHRPIPSKNIQFRFTFRVSETDRDDPFSIEKELPKVFLANDLSLMQPIPNISLGKDFVRVHVPSSFKGFVGDK